MSLPGLIELVREEGVEAAVLAYVVKFDWVTFVEIQRRLKDAEVETKGELAICSPQDPNLIFWANCNESFVELIAGMLKRKEVYFHPAHYLSYLADGGMLNMPIAQRPPTSGYKKPHWLPVCFRTVPLGPRKKEA